MDFLLGRFMDHLLEDIDQPTICMLEKLLEESDADIFDWIKNVTNPPLKFQEITRLIKSFHQLE